MYLRSCALLRSQLGVWKLPQIARRVTSLAVTTCRRNVCPCRGGGGSGGGSPPAGSGSAPAVMAAGMLPLLCGGLPQVWAACGELGKERRLQMGDVVLPPSRQQASGGGGIGAAAGAAPRIASSRCRAHLLKSSSAARGSRALRPFAGSPLPATPGVGRRTPTLSDAEAVQGVLRNGRFGSAGSEEPSAGLRRLLCHGLQIESNNCSHECPAGGCWALLTLAAAAAHDRGASVAPPPPPVPLVDDKGRSCRLEHGNCTQLLISSHVGINSGPPKHACPA